MLLWEPNPQRLPIFSIKNLLHDMLIKLYCPLTDVEGTSRWFQSFRYLLRTRNKVNGNKYHPGTMYSSLSNFFWKVILFQIVNYLITSIFFFIFFFLWQCPFEGCNVEFMRCNKLKLHQFVHTSEKPFRFVIMCFV